MASPAQTAGEPRGPPAPTTYAQPHRPQTTRALQEGGGKDNGKRSSSRKSWCALLWTMIFLGIFACSTNIEYMPCLRRRGCFDPCGMYASLQWADSFTGISDGCGD
jgi:hypothetical protein